MLRDLQLALEFFFGERALQLGELVFDFAVAGFQVELFGALEQNFVVDELLDDIEFQGKSIFLRWASALRRLTCER